MLSVVWIVLFVCAASLALISVYLLCQQGNRITRAPRIPDKIAWFSAESPQLEPLDRTQPSCPFGDVFALHPLRSVDPVCHTLVDLQNAKASLTRNGRTYLFCSEACLAQFEADPAGVYTNAANCGQGIPFRVLREQRVRAAIKALAARNQRD